MPYERRLILIVGDEESISGFAVQALESEGYRVTIALDGRQAWRMVETQMPDAILLTADRSVPEGFDFEGEFRRTYEYAVPILHLRSSSNSAASTGD